MAGNPKQLNRHGLSEKDKAKFASLLKIGETSNLDDDSTREERRAKIDASNVYLGKDQPDFWDTPNGRIYRKGVVPPETQEWDF